MSDDILNYVIVNGSGMIHAGFGGDDAPRTVFPSIVGRAKEKWKKQYGYKDCFVGDEAQAKRSVLDLNHPIQGGIVTNWDDMEKIWHDIIYNHLKTAPEDHHMFVTETPLNPKKNREKMIEIIFETFDCPGFYVAVSSTLPLYASGRTIGIVLDCGHTLCQAVPIYEGKHIPNNVEIINIGGRDITQYFAKLLQQERGYKFITAAEKEIVTDIKEKLGYIAYDYEEEERSRFAECCSELEQNYELPGGHVITVGIERYHAPEALFKPSWMLESVEWIRMSVLQRSSLINGYSRNYYDKNKYLHKDICGILNKYLEANGLNDGVHQLLYRSIMKCDKDIRNELYENIVISGGNTMFYGMGERLRNELKLLRGDSDSMKINVIAPPERKYSTWIGGSILSSLSSFNELWVMKEEYDEEGPSIVHKRCNDT